MIARILLPLALLVAAAPAEAQLTIKPGETWLFTLERGQPAHPRKVRANAAPKTGEIKASLRAMLGANLTISSNGKLAYTYRAELLDSRGKAKATRACTLPAGGKPTFEYWKDSAAAVRLSNFQPATKDGSCP